MPPREKHKSTPPESGADHIGALPDSILHHLLSFLPVQAAVQTCVLARRWRHLWRSTTGLRIADPDDEEESSVKDLRKVVDHLLILRERTDLDTVEIKFDEFREKDEPYVKTWVRYAVVCKVRVLTLRVGDSEYFYLDSLPLVSQHLRTLDLDGVGLKDAFLDFASCPALENLKMSICCISADDCSSDCVLLGGITNAKHLELLSESRMFVFTRDLKHCPTFSKLKTLLLNEYWCKTPDLDPLACILKNSPVLEKLTLQLFSKGPNHKVEMKGHYCSMDRPSAISEHLNIVEVKCNVVDERILKVLKFLSAFNICFSF